MCLIVLVGLGADRAVAQPGQDKERELGWSNSADLSLVLTKGNSAARTLGFTDRLRRVWQRSRLQVDVTSVRSDTSDDRFFLVDPGFVFPVGGTPDDVTFQVNKQTPTRDVANYLIGGRYDRNLTERFFWNAGASWDRNEDAGILHRYIAFAGIGNIWSDTENRQFSTSYGVSYSDRDEEEPDPEKDRQFGGARLAWDYLELLGAVTVFESVFTTNINLTDGSDYSFNTTNSVGVSMNEHLSLKVSLQLLYENKPALETDLDVIAHVDLIDPDGIPGTGDELFETVPDGGTKLVVGSADARKDRLDTVFRTALVISF